MGDILNLFTMLTTGIIFLILVSLVSLSAGIFLGAFLGKARSQELLNSILNLPLILVKEPKKLKSYWKKRQELRASRKISSSKR